MEKEAFWTFLEHKSEENGKDLIFHAENSTWQRQEEKCDDVRSKIHDDPEKTWRHQMEGVKSYFGDSLKMDYTWRCQTQNIWDNKVQDWKCL